MGCGEGLVTSHRRESQHFSCLEGWIHPSLARETAVRSSLKKTGVGVTTARKPGISACFARKTRVNIFFLLGRLQLALLL